MEGSWFPHASVAIFNNLAGDNSEEATPDPIPNSVVKLFRVDGTAWVTVWESRSLPAFFYFIRHLRRQLRHRCRLRARARSLQRFPRFLESARIKKRILNHS